MSSKDPAKIRLNPSDPMCVRPHLPSAERHEQNPPENAQSRDTVVYVRCVVRYREGGNRALVMGF